MADDQLKAIVQRMVQRGENEDAIAEVVRNYDAMKTATEPVKSHGGTEARPISTGGGRGTGLDVRKSDQWLQSNAPGIGAGIATVASGGASLPLAMLAAAGGGATGSLLRGDDPESAAIEGGKQAALEGAGAGLVKLGGVVARGLMKGAVPKNIGKEFDTVNIGQEMLDRGVFPGSTKSLGRVQRLSNEAIAERTAAAQDVPTMARARVINGLRPEYAKAAEGKMTDVADNAMHYMKKSFKQIGSEGLTGPQALSRKDILQDLSSAARGSSDTAAAVSIPGLADAERAAIVSHLRETPRMAKALDESQTLMAIDKVMQDAQHSNPVTRMRIGGLPAASLSPIGLATTAHAVNQGRKIANPQVLRLIDMLIGGMQ